ncbi:MAG: sodium:proton antiporter [bacterium]
MFWATALFIFIYAIIVSEKIHRTIITLVGAALFLLLGFVSQHEAISAIDFNTIGLLVGMMIIVGVLHHTGLFEYIAIKQAKAVKGDPWKLLFVFSIITAVGSAFLDNVTTVLLIVPVTLAIAKLLALPAVPFIISEILISNIGGTATLIGDPPNIMIGSALGIGFMDFIFNLTPVVIVIFAVSMFYLKIVYGKHLVLKEGMQDKLAEMDENKELKDLPLAKKCLFALAVTILGFMLHQTLHLESATVAMSGAALLLLISGVKVEKALGSVEWPVIFFFLGLFIMVGALEHVGLIELMASTAIEFTGGNLFVLAMVVMWGAGIGSAFLDNIPFVATAIPLLQTMNSQLGNVDFMPVWWALALGACLGGNGTMIGASANVAAIGIAEEKGVKISYLDYFKIAFPLTVLTLIIATGYVIWRYL